MGDLEAESQLTCRSYGLPKKLELQNEVQLLRIHFWNNVSYETNLRFLLRPLDKEQKCMIASCLSKAVGSNLFGKPTTRCARVPLQSSAPIQPTALLSAPFTLPNLLLCFLPYLSLCSLLSLWSTMCHTHHLSMPQVGHLWSKGI